ncbi:hypothetical protein [Sphingomonas japonica]|uniref:Uncharacterized protein n=2 Tax=Sphingomonas japonica TaxID=511662 RepID=A0ABX0U001_9SPHN|nr:hypothetical protein [Sphingomonas japonica]NIJ22737.1 hypothetical protein [Sphingomonas japonica]
MERPEVSDGERAFIAKRRRLRIIIGALLGLGLVLGIATGIDSARIGSGGAISPGVAVIGVIVMLAGVLGGSWFYFREIDELDLRDNLIAATVGLYFYALVYPCWYALSRGGIAPKTNPEMIFVATLVVVTLTYFWKRWRP